MLSVGQVLKSVSTPARSPGEGAIASVATAWINWLSAFCDPSDLLAPELVNGFFQDCLQFPHWQQNCKSLGDQIQRILENQCLQWDEIFEFQSVVWPQDLQWIEIRKTQDWLDVLQNHLRSEPGLKNETGLRFLHDSQLQKILALQLMGDGGISLREFNRQFFISEGVLQPLRSDLQISFDSRLNLKENIPHKIDCGPFMTARFTIESLTPRSVVYGCLTRGFDFANYQDLDGVPLETNPKLFYTLKRLEQHFLKRETNPFYTSVINSVEHCLRLLELKDETARNQAPQILSLAQNAVDYVFTEDKLLHLLIRDLQHTMSAKYPSKDKLHTSGLARD